MFAVPAVLTHDNACSSISQTHPAACFFYYYFYCTHMTFMPETDSVGIFLQEYLVRKEMECEVRTVFVWLSEGRSGTVAYASAAREAGSLSAEHLHSSQP